MHRRAVTHLKQADPVMARIIARVGPCRFEPRAAGTHFEAVARAIVYQQLSGKAAATIYRRFEALYAGHPPAPAALLALPDEALRGVGLSRQKMGYLRDLAGKVASGAVPMDRLHELPDDDVIAALTAVKGVGRWTAQMFLMFRLARPNVLPELDLGIRKAVMLEYGLRALPAPRQVARIGARWEPYATVACWYLWRVLDAPAPPPPRAARRPPAARRG